MKNIKLPSVLSISDEDLKLPFRHRAALVKGGRILSVGESSLGGCRYLTGHLGRSCHAEINACKGLSADFRANPRKGEKSHCL